MDGTPGTCGVSCVLVFSRGCSKCSGILAVMAVRVNGPAFCGATFCAPIYVHIESKNPPYGGVREIDRGGEVGVPSLSIQLQPHRKLVRFATTGGVPSTVLRLHRGWGSAGPVALGSA